MEQFPKLGQHYGGRKKQFWQRKSRICYGKSSFSAVSSSFLNFKSSFRCRSSRNLFPEFRSLFPEFRSLFPEFRSLFFPALPQYFCSRSGMFRGELGCSIASHHAFNRDRYIDIHMFVIACLTESRLPEGKREFHWVLGRSDPGASACLSALTRLGLTELRLPEGKREFHWGLGTSDPGASA